MTWFKIALRNILKNGRRSFFTILAIAVGFAAINIFGGFESYIFRGLRDAVIYAQGQGHLAIFKKGVNFFDKKADPAYHLIPGNVQESAQKIVTRYSEVILMTGELNISGLLSNGDVSTVFLATGRVPSDMQKIRSQGRGMIGKIRLYTGKPLADSLSYGIGLSSGLAKKLEVKIDSEVIAMAPTTDGQINALDAKVMQLFESPAASLDDKLMLVPLKFAQSLYDTDGADFLVVLLKDTRMAPSMKTKLNRAFTDAGIDLEAKTWNEIAPFYTKVKNMFRIIFIFLFVIVLVIVVMSTINTMSMTVMERIKEIGTLRSLGIRQRGIILLFAIESALLGILGSCLGLALTLTGWLAVKMAQPTWIPPHITKRVPIEVYLVPEYLVLTGFLLVALSLTAAVIPARKAAGMNIVDALGHV